MILCENVFSLLVLVDGDSEPDWGKALWQGLEELTV